jgi:hypothetical protein
MTPFAHAGHLLIDLPLYGIPVLAVILALVVSTARSRRSRAKGGMRRRPRSRPVVTDRRGNTK